MDISRRRKRIALLYQKMGKCLQVFLGRPPMVRGIVYELKRKCGKPTCRCTRGELHRSQCLSYYAGKGARKLVTLKGGEVERYRQSTKNYQRFYRARARFVQLSRQIVEELREIERSRMNVYEERKQ